MKQKKDKRIDWIDTLRGLSMFFVVWGHSFPSVNWFLRKWIYSFHMPIFFFISGLVHRNEDTLPFKEFLKNKIKGLIIPYIAVNIVCFVAILFLYYIGFYKTIDVSGLLFGMFYSNDLVVKAPCGQAWFILCLFIAEIMFYFLKKISTDDKHLFTNVLIVGLIGYATTLTKYEQPLPWHFDTAFTGVVLYFVGYIFMKHISKFKSILENDKKKFFIGLFLGLLGGLVCYANGRVSMHANNYGSISLFYISVLSTIFGFVCFVNLFMKKSVVFRKVGTYTIFYLAYHVLIMRIITKIYPIINTSNIYLLLFSIATFFAFYPIAIFVYKHAPFIVGKFNWKKASKK